MSATGGTAPGTTPAFPWDDALSLALGRLRWRPRDLWRATPHELLFAAGLRASGAGLGRDGLARLIQDHPDTA
ncbi:phage tail assembly chaperone [Methylobacterium sp. WL120]|uniref:phage tail assembly chaperone n=1 Tax=Methylobacterium sp. WL120 TaxID=2603887 RepID=UPI0011C9FF37|nr:phage tail assembly chaperone [Methylobacterium sp. WL120]TXM59601.1 phage tail assembly chaperone [Methylobacterium sp. WL120]